MTFLNTNSDHTFNDFTASHPILATDCRLLRCLITRCDSCFWYILLDTVPVLSCDASGVLPGPSVSSRGNVLLTPPGLAVGGKRRDLVRFLKTNG